MVSNISADDGAPSDSVGGSSLGKSRRNVHRCYGVCRGGCGESVYFFFQLFFHLLTQLHKKIKRKNVPCGAGVGSHKWTSSRLPQ